MARIVIHREGQASEVLRISGTRYSAKDCGCARCEAKQGRGLLAYDPDRESTEDAEVGRPTDNPKTERADVRLTPAQKKKFLARQDARAALISGRKYLNTPSGR